MQLISLPVSPFAARVRIAIYAKGLPVELVPPPLGWPHNRQFRDLNPTGRVPVLLDEHGTLWESAVLLEFLEDRFPDAASLMPSDPYDRARARILVSHVDQHLMPPMVALAKASIDAAGTRQALSALTDGLTMIDGLLSGTPYAVSDKLTIADCALAPALFAARVTGERACMDLIEPPPSVAAYSHSMRHDQHIARVLDEMDQGLRLLTSRS